MHNTEKRVEQLLTNSNQALNFLRAVLDDLIIRKEQFTLNSQKKIVQSQQNYKKNKAVLTNIENLINKGGTPITRKTKESFVAESPCKNISNYRGSD